MENESVSYLYCCKQIRLHMKRGDWMTHQKLDSSIKQFKRFVNQYPRLCEDIHRNKVSIQSVYEKWMQVGEGDSYWHAFSDEQLKENHHNIASKQTGELMQTIMDATKNMDLNKVQSYVEQVSTAVQNVQEVVESFRKTKEQPQRQFSQPSSRNVLFRRMRD